MRSHLRRNQDLLGCPAGTGAAEKGRLCFEGLLKDLGTVAQQAAEEKGPGASSDEVAAQCRQGERLPQHEFLVEV